MVHTHIVPFTDEHLEAAAALLAVRQRTLCARQPELPTRFGDVDAARALIQAHRGRPSPEFEPFVASAGTRVLDGGVAAVRGGRLVGYLLAWTWTAAPFLRSRSAGIELGGHAVHPDSGSETYRAMYAAVAPRWIARGHTAHYVNIAAADRTTLDAWASLGFGREHTRATRTTAPLANVPDAHAFRVRQATPTDLVTVQAFEEGLGRYHAEPPIFLPFLPETAASGAAKVAAQLADESVAVWLAERDGVPLAMQTFVPERPYTVLVAPEPPQRSIHLSQGYTVAEARGSGVGSALLDRAMAWARDAGQTHCTVSWWSANLSGGRFWQRQGFRPTQHRLVRVVDERILWAR